MVSAHYRSHVEFSYEALDEAAAGFRRVENFLERAATALGEPGRSTSVSDGFVEAMDDDLGTPAAVAALFDAVREGNRLLTEGAADGLREVVGSVVAMLDVLGLNPADPVWGSGGRSDVRLANAVDVLVAGLLEQRAEARSRKDFATADAVRDQIKAAGIEVEDTPAGPKWTLAEGTS